MPSIIGDSIVSDHFTCPLKILDMMAHETPIVASDLPTVRALLTNEEDALLVPSNDPRALAGGIDRLLADRPLAHRLAARARERVRAFTWAERASRLGAFLDGLVPG